MGDKILTVLVLMLLFNHCFCSVSGCSCWIPCPANQCLGVCLGRVRLQYTEVHCCLWSVRLVHCHSKILLSPSLQNNRRAVRRATSAFFLWQSDYSHKKEAPAAQLAWKVAAYPCTAHTLYCKALDNLALDLPVYLFPTSLCSPFFFFLHSLVTDCYCQHVVYVSSEQPNLEQSRCFALMLWYVLPFRKIQHVVLSAQWIAIQHSGGNCTHWESCPCVGNALTNASQCIWCEWVLNDFRGVTFYLPSAWF